jgi:MFS family permease
MTLTTSIPNLRRVQSAAAFHRTRNDSSDFSQGNLLTSARPKIFYGWWITATAALGLCLGAAPIIVYAFGVFLKPLSVEFRANRAAISFAFTLQNLAAALFAPLIGRLIDRFGARKIILPGTLILGLVLVSSKMLPSRIAMFYIFFAALGIIQGGTSPLSYGVIVSHWFNRHRGLALGGMMLGIGIGAITIPIAVQRIIALSGWRMAYTISGLAAIFISLPIAAAFLKNDPKEKGLLPDGIISVDSIQQSAAEMQSRKNEEGLAWSETWRTREFWLLTSAFFLASAAAHACVLHMPAMLTDRGATPQAAALASSVIGVALLISRTATGYFLDRFSAPLIAALFFSGAAIGIFVLMLGAAGITALAAAFLIGMGFGAEGDIIAYALTRYFGLKSFGTAYGYVFGAFLLAGAAGTLLMGAGFDFTHAYKVPLAGFLIAMSAAAFLMTRLGPYRYSASRSS